MFSFPRKLTHDDVALNVDMPEDMPDKQFNDDNCLPNVQEIAVAALKLGLAIQAKGYNIFVLGESGLSKHGIIRQILDDYSRTHDVQSRLKDVAYVRNFKDANRPIPLIFPAGQAKKFKIEIESLLERLKDGIFSSLDEPSFRDKRNEMTLELERKESMALTEFQTNIRNDGFHLVQSSDEETEARTDILPVVDGVPKSFDELRDYVRPGNLSEEEWLQLRERYYYYADTMKRLYRQIKGEQDALEVTLRTLRNKALKDIVETECKAVSKKWLHPDVEKYLSALAEDVIENAEWLISDSERELTELKRHYEVNIILDRTDCHEIPIIDETNPTKTNLCGAVEIHQDMTGDIHADLGMITPGSLLKADGGFLLIQADDLFTRETLWTELKRYLQTSLVAPEVLSTPLGTPPVLMSPKPVKTTATVVLVGNEKSWETLRSMDEDFPELFKVCAVFKVADKRTPRLEQFYSRFLNEFTEKEVLKPITPDGKQAFIRYGIELAERRDMISLKMGRIADLCREANTIADNENKSCLDADIINLTIKHRNNIESIPTENLAEEIKNGTYVLEVAGKHVGIVNGLAVLDRASACFGTVLRISVAIGPGKDGLINIEREAGLSGELHDKGIYLMEGYLRQRFARYQNLSLSAGIAIEQSYAEIDGDSASAAELAALLSAIAMLPVRQDVAITGAVNQQGMLLPVGGIRQKIEGFYQACRARGWTGSQGVVLPVSSVNSIILPEEISQSFKDGQFHLWAAVNMDEVMTLLTGLPAGKERRNGRFAKNSINEKIRRGLLELSTLGGLQGE